ncbi:YqaA family protein [Aquabacterium sp.]|uniref:YqaA family protein n=1 Tax=Aquabacterium sp. TaxID=1872578 RepID=UPI0019C76E19|nr:YqaA family protein [Aquabacterium sp.]MBC7699130.1 DedA family protein [Aquabacterium sp.]
MEAWMVAGVSSLLQWFALPQVGLSAVFVVAFVSATLLPLGSEPAVFALIKLNPELFWPAVLIATLGNTLGGIVTWWMGWWARRGTEKVTHHPANTNTWALRWLQRFGAKACLLSWLPIVGDPLCAVAGWLRLPFWPCVACMAVGKFARYITLTAFMLWVV